MNPRHTVPPVFRRRIAAHDRHEALPPSIRTAIRLWLPNIEARCQNAFEMLCFHTPIRQHCIVPFKHFCVIAWSAIRFGACHMNTRLKRQSRSLLTPPYSTSNAHVASSVDKTDTGLTRIPDPQCRCPVGSAGQLRLYPSIELLDRRLARMPFAPREVIVERGRNADLPELHQFATLDETAR